MGRSVCSSARSSGIKGMRKGEEAKGKEANGRNNPAPLCPLQQDTIKPRTDLTRKNTLIHPRIRIIMLPIPRPTVTVPSHEIVFRVRGDNVYLLEGCSWGCIRQYWDWLEEMEERMEEGERMWRRRSGWGQVRWMDMRR